MIERVTMYIAKCDRCGEILQDGEIVAWADTDEAQRMAEESEWREINGRLLCPDCYERWIEKYNQWRKENNI